MNPPMLPPHLDGIRVNLIQRQISSQDIGEYTMTQLMATLFIGLITRDDGSHESIATRLDSTLLSNVCYQFGIDLAHSKTYSGYNKPIKIKIWIGTEKCEKTQLIFESPIVDHKEWKSYYIQFTPKVDNQYILLEAFYKDNPTPHKGNILIDYMTTVQVCNRA